MELHPLPPGLLPSRNQTGCDDETEVEIVEGREYIILLDDGPQGQTCTLLTAQLVSVFWPFVASAL